ncbi:hypothetical protein Q669_06380 [Labrenzia sp. C1B10]|nr:hypothetical protein Q669_06380 [Labrenzia sp. C1B10]ERS08604.1 hypothetical protein Q675_18505 [Labrenzia sp. C1B70]
MMASTAQAMLKSRYFGLHFIPPRKLQLTGLSQILTVCTALHAPFGTKLLQSIYNTIISYACIFLLTK